jgi:hypothetical protein
MELTTVPGYDELFGKRPKTYEEFLKGIPTRLVLPIAIGINAETYASLPYGENQKRIRDLFSEHFTAQQANAMSFAYERYRKFENPTYKGELFGNRYLIEMCIRELNRNDQTENAQMAQQDDFSFIQAYLTVVQDVNDEDEVRMEKLKSAAKDEDYDYRILWEGFIRQHEFTDDPHPAFNVYKLLQFCLYVREAFPKRFKEYLNKFDFKAPVEFIGSFTVLADAAIKEFQDKLFRKVNFIHTENPIQDQHLAALDISPLLKKRTPIALNEIKMYPLYLMDDTNYQIIDQRLFLKKIYTGPFFELFKKTGLKKDLGKTEDEAFNTYSSLVSEQVLEKRCFKDIIMGLRKMEGEFLYFDDGTDNCPDAYCRFGNTIFLIEFKGYVFPSNLSDNPEFAKIKQYIDEKMVEKPGGKGKGVGQLATQVTLLAEGKFNFDAEFNEELRNKPYTIYPIICHTDYYFSMVGVNSYLNREFADRINPAKFRSLRLKDVAVIDLANLFDMIHHETTFNNLAGYIDSYHQRLINERRLQEKGPSIAHFLQSYAGFDEMYRTVFSFKIRQTPLARAYINRLLKESKDILQNPL